MLDFHSDQSLVVQLAGTRSYACSDYKTKQPKVNDKGLQQYSFTIQVPGVYRFEQYPIKVYAKDDPIAGAEMGDSVELSGVVVQLGYLSSEDGKRQQFWSITAESVAIKKAKE